MSGGQWIAIVAILIWPAVLIYRMYQGSRMREFEHRERLAMIERGLMPSPERDPEHFERVMRTLRGHHEDMLPRRDRVLRGRKFGVLLICVGLGSALLIGMSSEEDIREAIGVGGLLAFIGVAFLVNSLFDARAMETAPPPSTQAPPPPAPPSPSEPGDARVHRT